jgi:hypothetical protein
MSQRFNSMDFLPEGREIIDFIPQNKYATLQSKCDFRWLCDTLIQTYNTSVLDVSDPTFKDACIEQAHKCVREENRTSERTVLSQLILNHSNENDPTVPKEDKKPIADFIGGPATLTMHWSKQYKKLIYIFGEKHSEETDCRNFYSKKYQDKVMLIEDYLEQLFKNTDAFIDFYLETERTYQDIYGNSRIALMAKRFKDCFHNPKENENKCKLSRMHYFDVRGESSDLKPNSMSYASYSMYMIYFEFIKQNLYLEQNIKLRLLASLLEQYDYDIKIKPVLEEFSEIDFYDEEKDDIKYMEYDEFWDKQIKEQIFVIKKVYRSTIHNIIKSFIKKELRNPDKYFKKGFPDSDKHSQKIDIKKLVKTVREFIATLDKYSTGTTNNYDFESIREDDSKILLNLEFSSVLLAINALITTDYYLLCRIFKIFDLNPENKDKKRSTDEPNEPHNIIIYAGDAHSETVRKFLKELEFRDISHVNTKSYVSNCINMHGFPQPFFSNHKKIKWSDELLDEFVVDEEIVDLESAAADEDLYS